MERDRLQAAYEATKYWVEFPPGSFYLRCGEVSESLDALLDARGEDEWGYLTANNPNSVRVSDEENERRNSRLARRMASDYVVFSGLAVSDDGGWSEHSFLVLGMPLETVLKLAVEFEQNAILAGRRGEAARIVWVADEER